MINGLNNEEIYYAKIADELIRYNRLKSFILEPENYLTLSKIDYNLTDNEILILQSLITQEYFENLIRYNNSQYLDSKAIIFATDKLNTLFSNSNSCPNNSPDNVSKIPEW